MYYFGTSHVPVWFKLHSREGIQSYNAYYVRQAPIFITQHDGGYRYY